MPTLCPSAGSQQLPQTLAQSIYQGEVIMDRAGRVIFANATAEMLLGFAPRDLLGRYCEEFLEHDVCALTALSAGQAHRYTTKLRHSDGRLIPTTITVTSTELFGNTFASFLFPPSPPWPQRYANDGATVGGDWHAHLSIAHELNTPLAIITSTCENLRELVSQNDVPLERLQRYAEMIERAVGGRPNWWRFCKPTPVAAICCKKPISTKW
ncbi:MAG: PAS domain-containing protein [Chloroflexi bacterium]|nr:PAS domain-containing protein [Chloroflexota bacterium]